MWLGGIRIKACCGDEQEDLSTGKDLPPGEATHRLLGEHIRFIHIIQKMLFSNQPGQFQENLSLILLELVYKKDSRAQRRRVMGNSNNHLSVIKWKL